MSRRALLLTSLLGVTALVCMAPALAAQKFTWKMQSTWSAGDFHHQNPSFLVKTIQEMSGGRLTIELLPAGAVVAPFEVLDAVNRGVLDAGHAWPGYWTGKHPAATLFASAAGGPFGMNAEDFLAWIFRGGGLELYNELLQKELGLNVVAFPTFGEVPEPLGWFPKPIKTVKEFKGLKFRAAGMAAEVFKAMGMTVVTLPGAEIIPALERGIIDAAEYSEPSSDLSIGFPEIRKFYHLPGVHQPTGIMEFLINKERWDALPNDLKAIVRYAAMAATLEFTLKIRDLNSRDLKKIVEDKKVQVIEAPREVLVEVLKAWDTVAARHARENPFFKKVLESQRAWARRIVPYRRVADPPYDLAADYYWGEINPYKVKKP